MMNNNPSNPQSVYKKLTFLSTILDTDILLGNTPIFHGDLSPVHHVTPLHPYNHYGKSQLLVYIPPALYTNVIPQLQTLLQSLTNFLRGKGQGIEDTPL